MSKKIAVIGVGNMAKAIISGIRASKVDVSEIHLYDVNPEQYSSISGNDIVYTNSIEEAVSACDCVLISVKPQNYPDVLPQIAAVPFSPERIFITIAAGRTVDSVSKVLKTDNVVRVLPNLPMFIMKGVSAICYNANVNEADFNFIVDIFESAGSVLKIEECDINKIIGVTSSSPAYVFKFIKAVCDGAKLQGLECDGILEAVCDVMIGSAELIKSGFGTPEALAKAVASKGGTTERALAVLDDNDFEKIIADAMIACTKRADELGK